MKNEIGLSLFGMGILAIGILGLLSCQKQTDDVGTFDLLRADQILLRARLPVFPAFVDINGDSLPDLFLGSIGHVLAGENYVRHSSENQLSIHLNRTRDDRIAFAAPHWLSHRMENAILPAS